MSQIAIALEDAGASVAVETGNAGDSAQSAAMERVFAPEDGIHLASDMGAQEISQDSVTQQAPASEDDGDSAIRLQASEFPFEVPEDRYVFEYVYGVLGDDQAIVSNEAPFDYYHQDGVLVLKDHGVALEEGVTVRPRDVTRGLRFTPFKQNGKWGVYDLEAQRPSIEAKFDIVEDAMADKPTSRYGFIQLGNQSADGVYPDAAAVICSGEQEFARIPLGGYVKDGRLYSFKVGEASYWNISWSRVDASGNEQYAAQRYSDSDDPADIFLVSQSSSSRIQSTFDGRTVDFYVLEEKVYFTVQGKDGACGRPITLPTDVVDVYSCDVVSNIIQVRKSNGFDYQYFTLDGKLLQNLNGQSLTALGNHVSYERVAFDSQQTVRVFLDTSDECREAREIPVVKSSFPYIYDSRQVPVFECLTKENQIERYDQDLNLVATFSPVANLVERHAERRGISWSLAPLSDDAWVLSETVRSGTGWNAAILEQHMTVLKAGVPIAPSALGLSSDLLESWGTFGDYAYLMDDSGSYKVRIYDKSLTFQAELDALPFVNPAAESVEVSIVPWWEVDYGPVPVVNPFKLRVSQWLPADAEHADSYSETTTRYLDGDLRLTDLSGFRSISGGQLLIAQKDDKWGFVDEDLNPLTDFIYDDVEGNSSGGANVKEGGKWRFLDNQLRDVLGGLFDSITSWTLGHCLVCWNDGSFFVYDSHFRQVNMQGYQPVVLDGLERIYPTCRFLPDGRLLIYAWDSQGNLGAIDDAGNVVIPFAFKDYAECADLGDSENIMLRDEEGWFFISLDDILKAPPASDDCDELGHDYEDVIYEPTCTTNGYVQHVCKRCGHGYRDDAAGNPMLGHDFVLVAAATEPTCTEPGKGAEYVCSRCQVSKKDDDIPSLGGHAYSEWRVVDYPSCTEDGHTERVCTRCGDIDRATVYAYGHSWASPTWEWTGDFSAAVARTSCERGCGEELSIDVEARHEKADSGMRHVVQTTIDGRRYQDGRLVLDWVDSDGASHSMLVKGSPVADGFSVQPDAIKLAADKEGPLELDVSPVQEGGVFDALVSKIGSGWPAGTFDIRLSIGGEEIHDGFGELAVSFPVGVESAGKRATVYHCHKNDRDNITAHDLVVSENGMAVLTGIFDLSTFLVAVQDSDAPTQGGSAPGQSGVNGPGAAGTAPTTTAGLSTNGSTAGSGSSLAKTGDGVAVVAGISAALGLGTFLALVLTHVAGRRRSQG